MSQNDEPSAFLHSVKVVSKPNAALEVKTAEFSPAIQEAITKAFERALAMDEQAKSDPAKK